MSIADGMILFIACALSFALGYGIGAFRVTRFVTKELKVINLNLQQHTRELQQFVSRLGEDETQK
jgi:hypothetical protein